MDLMALVRGFERGELEISRLNYALITLIPKEEGVKSLKKFRPISLINCSCKIFSKALNNRLMPICDRLLSGNLTAFVKGMFILQSVVFAHEIIHETARNNQKGVVLKLDYEKAYGRVSWHFLEELMSTRGFGSRWRKWVMALVKNGSIAIRINDSNSGYFRPGKGLRQGDLQSPLLFNLVADVFTRILIRAAKRGHITGLLNSLYPEGIISMQYADDTLLFLDHDFQATCHLKWLMVCFEHLFGMRIYYHKSDMTPINLDEGEANQYAKVFCCKVGTFPFRYLGAPLHFDKLRREDIQPVVDAIMKRIPGWRGRLLSHTECLSSKYTYLLNAND
jgi:hypothetical protein